MNRRTERHAMTTVILLVATGCRRPQPPTNHFKDRKMKQLTGILIGLILFSTAVPGFAKSDSSKAEARIAELETVWNQAHLHGDVDALDRLWADSLTVIVPEMPPFSKPALLKMWRGMKVSITEYATSDVKIHVYGQSAIATGRLHRVRDFGGNQATDDWLFTKAYARIGGDWKVTAYHASVVPARK